MTGRRGLDNLVDALVEDILSTPDDVIEAEALEDGVDLEATAANGRALVERAKAESARRNVPLAQLQGDGNE